MIYNFAALTFTEDENIKGRVYWYLCDGDLKIGECVLAPVGSHNRLQLARVERVLQTTAENAPYDIALIKSVAAKYGKRRIPLVGAKNCRELGGLRYCNKFFTRFNVFLRSDFPTTRADIERLQDYGVETFIDLREESEHGAEEDFGISCISCSVKGDPQCSYCDLAESDGMRRALIALSEADGCALFGCHVGKDRTGIISMLLLLLAGVDEETVKADFRLSYAAVGETKIEVRERKLCDFLCAVSTYGGAEGFLEHLGLSAATINKLKTKLR